MGSDRMLTTAECNAPPPCPTATTVQASHANPAPTTAASAQTPSMRPDVADDCSGLRGAGGSGRRDDLTTAVSALLEVVSAYEIHQAFFPDHDPDPFDPLETAYLWFSALLAKSEVIHTLHLASARPG